MAVAKPGLDAHCKQSPKAREAMVRIRARFQPGFNRAETTAKGVAALAAGGAGAKARVDAAPPSGTTEVVP